MHTMKIWIRMLLVGSTLVGLFSCENQNDSQQSTEVSTAPPAQSNPDLSRVLEMRIEGNSEDAIKLLREMNEEFPNSPEILLQLARSLEETSQFPLAAFRFDQALSAGAEKSTFLEAAKAHLQAEDQASAIIRFEKFLNHFPENLAVWLQLGRLLAQTDRETDAINALSKGSEKASHKDCMLLGNLFFQKKLMPQAEYWYRESAKRDEGINPEPLLGILRIHLFSRNLDSAESLILAIEKSNPGTLIETDLSQESADLLRSRRLSDLIDKGFSPTSMNVSQLALALLRKEAQSIPQVVSSSKLPPPREENELVDKSTLPEPEESSDSSTNLSDPSLVQPEISSSLADAFSSPIDVDLSGNPLEQARTSYLQGNYLKCINFARSAIKENPNNPDAWRTCSQAHFQLGESREAEMTILEAIRHDPLRLDYHLDYLRIARETLDGKRYLVELEKVHELFPESAEVIWQLARRYHLVEKMPATASVLYRKLIRMVPEGSSLFLQAEMELLKLQNL